MSFYQKYRSDIRNLLFLFGMFLLARILFITLMPATYSKDLYAWLHVIDVLRAGGNPYAQTEVLNWPPFWMQFIFLVGQASLRFNTSPITLIQALLITFEALNMFLVYGILKRFLKKTQITKVLLFGLALNPVCLFLSCQHCNFDIFVGFWVLLFTWSLLEFYEHQSPVSWLQACFFVGMGILTKTIPVILTPLLFISSRKQTAGARILGLLLLFTPVLIGMSVIYSLAPEGVTNNVLGYRSMAGWYGITGILGFLNAGFIVELYKTISPFVFIAFMALMARRFYNKPLTPVQLITLTLLLILFIPTFGPGYSPPYICWFLSLLVIVYTVSTKPMKRLMLAGYIIIILTYTVEYAIFNSHGAFLVKIFPSSPLLNGLSDQLSARSMQLLIRLPMFLFYCVLFIALARSLKREQEEPANAPLIP